jgi:hypothetical protein
MKMEREELSLGSAATADATVLYSPEVVVPARTIIEPEGGEVRVAASTAWHSDKPMANDESRKEKFLYMADVEKPHLSLRSFKDASRRKYRGIERFRYITEGLLQLFTRALCLSIPERRDEVWSHPAR